MKILSNKLLAITMAFVIFSGILLSQCFSIEATADATVEVTEIRLSKSELEIPEGCSAYINNQRYEEDIGYDVSSGGSTWSGKIDCLVLPTDAIDKKLVWTSSNSDVAKIENGYIRAIGSGTATITAASSNGIMANCIVTVPKTTISLSNTQLTLTEGETAVFYLSKPRSNVSFMGDIQYLKAYLSPEYTGERDVTLESDNENVVKINGDDIIAVSYGKANVIARLKNGNSAICEITVPKTEITLNKSEISVKKGQLIRLSIPPINGYATSIEPSIGVIFTPSNTHSRDITWSTDNSKVLTLGETGITANTSGTATITAKLSNGNEAVCKVNVISDVTDIYLNKESASVRVGDIFNLNATILPDDATDKNVIWTSSDEKIATVDNGVVEAKDKGITVITAKSSNGLRSTCVVFVDNVVPNRILLNCKNISISEREEYTLVAKIEPNNVTDKSVDWISLDEDIVTINNGRVVGVTPGTTNVVAVTNNGKIASCKITVGKAPLTNISTLDSCNVMIGESIKIYADSYGGIKPYTFAYYYKKSTDNSWTKIAGYSTTTLINFKPSEIGKYILRVNIKDDSGKIAIKDFTVTVKAAVVALANNSTVSTISLSANNEVILTGKATGGAGPYTYAYYYKKSTDSSWTNIAGYSTSTLKSFTPTLAGTYTARVNVKDSSGKLVQKDFTVTVTADNSALTNNSTVSATNVIAGTEVTMTGKATGGTSPYKYAYYYKKSTDSVWTKAYVTSSGSAYTKYDSMKFTPTTAGTYDVRINVKDEYGNGKTVTKDFTITVK